MFELEAPLVARREVARDMQVLSFRAPEVAATACAGQFVNLLLRPGPLLRRPFSIYSAQAEQVEVLLKPVGAGTAELAALALGDCVSLLGPLGSGFQLDPAARSVALVSGGLGVAPMPLAARAAAELALQVHWVHGARSAADLCSEWAGSQVHWATDDGSRGWRGSALAAIPEGVGQVLACGPIRMLASLAARFPLAQVAIETYMGCGTGVCLGCAVPRTHGVYDRACKEGPVYQASSVRWDQLPQQLHYGLGD